MGDNQLRRKFGSQPPTVALVEPLGEGHHPMYVAGYWQAFESLGCRTLFVGPRQVANDAEAAFPAGRCVIPSDRLLPWDPVGQGITRGLSAADAARALWQSLVHTLGPHAPDLTFLLSLDNFVTDLSHRPVRSDIPWRFSGLWFRPPTPLPGTLREAVQRGLRWRRAFHPLRLPQCGPILVLDDPSTIGHLEGYTSHGVISAPEFSTYERSSEPTPRVAETLSRIGGRRVVALVGSLEPRKGVHAFLRAASVADPAQWAFVLAGRLYRRYFNQETLATLDRLATGESPRILLQEGWMQTEEINDLTARADLMFLCYEKWRFSTNMLCKTAFFRIPVLAHDAGYVGRLVRRHRLGKLAGDGTDVADLFRGDRLGSEVESLRRSPEFEKGCRDYLERNSLASLGTVLPALFDDFSPTS